MKKTILLFSALLLTAQSFSQTKNAAICFLYERRPEITFYGINPPRASEAPSIYFNHGKTFNDSILFQSIKNKIAGILPQLGFILINEDSIINTTNYKNLAKKNSVEKTPNTLLAKGYAYPANFALLFTNANDPDIMIEAYGEYDLNNETRNDFKYNNAMLTYLNYNMTIVGFNPKKKKVFVFKTKYKHPDLIKLKASNTSPWGYEIDEDMSKKQNDCLIESFKLIDNELPEQIERTTKFYLK